MSMTLNVPQVNASPLTDPPQKQGGAKRKKNFRRALLLQITAMVGIGALVYPNAANWFAGISQRQEIVQYHEQVDELSQAEQERTLASARAFNENLPSGVIRDPYLLGTDDTGDEQTAGSYFNGYFDQLRVGGDGVMAQLSYPRLDIALPIYHGTNNEVLEQGVGHLLGSSLPVGGPSTHSVLTSHSGMVHAELFTPLHDAVIGDQITLNTLGEDLHYEVRTIAVVEPNQTEMLSVREGEDWLTLITCTPIGVNSHRIVLQAQRVFPDANTTTEITETPGTEFPWWAVIFLGGSAAIAAVLFAPPRNAQKRRSPQTTAEEQA